jgi:hypothetical protein
LLLGFVGLVTVVACVLSVVQVILLDGEATTVAESADEARLEAEAAHYELAAVSTALADAGATLRVRQGVLDERPAFIEAVRSAGAAFEAAAGKVDVSTAHAAVLQAQATVLAETESTDAVKAQTAAVTQATADVTAAVAAFDARKAAENVKKPAGSAPAAPLAPTTSQPAPPPAPALSWFDDMRQRLNNAGGSHVSLFEYDGQCGGRYAVACSFAGVGIGVHSGIASWTSARKNWVATHELAHQYHFAVWNQVASSGGYGQLFGGDPELLANCMSSARGVTNHGHAGACTRDRIDWAAQIWNGVVPW